MLNSQINRRILRFGATPQTKQEDTREPGSRRRKLGDQEKRKHQEGGRQDTTVQQSFLLQVPNFVLWYEQCSYVNSFILSRTRHLLLDHCLSIFTVLMTAVLLLLSPPQCP